MSYCMSSFTVLSFFALASGCCLQTLKPGTTTCTWHAHYTTTIQCISPLYLPADLCIYSPINDIVHADDTIAFVIARLYVLPTGDVLLDEICIIPCPGDPSSDSYNETVANFQFLMVYGLGVVFSMHETLPNRLMGPLCFLWHSLNMCMTWVSSQMYCVLSVIHIWYQ